SGLVRASAEYGPRLEGTRQEVRSAVPVEGGHEVQPHGREWIWRRERTCRVVPPEISDQKRSVRGTAGGRLIGTDFIPRHAHVGMNFRGPARKRTLRSVECSLRENPVIRAFRGRPAEG